MNNPRKDHWSYREEQFHKAIRDWLRQANKEFDQGADIGSFAQHLSLPRTHAIRTSFMNFQEDMFIPVFEY